MATYMGSKLPKNKVAFFSLHPGAIQTLLGRHMNPDITSDVLSKIPSTPDMEPVFFKTVQQGCATQLVAALDPKLQDFSGSYLNDCQLNTAAEHATKKENVEALWNLSEDILGEKFDL